MKDKNTFGDYKFEEWVPDETRESIKSFWGIFGRTHRDWITCCESEATQQCSHGPGPNGFGCPPNGATADYMVLDYKLSKQTGEDIFRVVRGRYLHKWNNIGVIIDEYGQAHHVSSCNRWVRVWTKDLT